MTLYLLDTDMLTHFQAGNGVVVDMIGRLSLVESNTLATSVISVEEQLTGWYSYIRRAKSRQQQISGYQKLTDQVRFLSRLQIITFGASAMDRHDQLKSLRLNIGGDDLKIAGIALDSTAILITRNRRDFQRVPNLILLDWTI